MKDINVLIGDVKKGAKGNKLHAILGSCIGIAFICKHNNQSGLAHCLLPNAPKTDFTINGKYVDQAIHSLLALMKIRREDYNHVQAVIAGGGNMTKPNSNSSDELVGDMNVESAVHCLKNLGIKIIHQETGGSNGRKISVDCTTGSFNICTIPRIQNT